MDSPRRGGVTIAGSTPVFLLCGSPVCFVGATPFAFGSGYPPLLPKESMPAAAATSHVCTAAVGCGSATRSCSEAATLIRTEQE